MPSDVEASFSPSAWLDFLLSAAIRLLTIPSLEIGFFVSFLPLS